MSNDGPRAAFREFLAEVRRSLPELPRWLKAILGGLYTAGVSLGAVAFSDEIETAVPGLTRATTELADGILGIPTVLVVLVWLIYRQRKIRSQLTRIEERMSDTRADGGTRGESVVVVLALGALAGAAIGTYFGDGIEPLAGALVGAYLLYVYDHRTA